MLQGTSKCFKPVVSPAETPGDMGTSFFLFFFFFLCHRKLQVADSWVGVLGLAGVGKFCFPLSKRAEKQAWALPGTAGTLLSGRNTEFPPGFA